MGWSDSEDDDDLDVDLDAVLKENERRQRREEGLPSESEEEDEEEVVVKPQHPVEKKEEIYVPLADPVAEKARQKKLQEEQEMAGFGDLLGSEFVKVDEEAERKKKEEETKAAAAKAEAKAKPKVEVHDEFIERKIETTAEFNNLTTQIAEKIKESPLKGGAVRFINEAIKQLLDDLSISELENMDKKIADMLKQKKVAKTEKEAKEQKGNVTVTKNTKFNVKDELDTMYGGGWDDGDWDENDWDEEDWE